MKKIEFIWILLGIQIILIAIGIITFYNFNVPPKLNKLQIFEIEWSVIGPVLLFSLFLGFTIYNLKHVHENPMEVRTFDRCIVCGAYVFQNNNTASEIYMDGRYIYFDTPKDMLKFIFDMDTYIKIRKLNFKDKRIKSIYTKSFDTKSWENAKNLYYVFTENDVIPFKNLEEIKKIYNSKDIKVLHFNEIKKEDVIYL